LEDDAIDSILAGAQAADILNRSTARVMKVCADLNLVDPGSSLLGQSPGPMSPTRT
jgi:hypothetical protein